MSLKPAHDPSCVLAYSFEEASNTTVYDQSQYGRNGTISGATRVQGKLGKGMYFDGVDDYVQSSAFALTGTAISIVAWVKCAKYNKVQTIINKGTTSPTIGYIYLFRFIDTNTLGIQYANGTTNEYAQAVDYFTGYDNVFVNVALTCDYSGKLTKFYRNGQIYMTFDMSGTPVFPSSNTVCLVGRYTSGINEFKGVIDEVRLYNRLLTDQEIRMIYENEKDNYR